MKLDLTTEGKKPFGDGVWLSWAGKTKSGMACRSRVLVVAEERMTLAGLMLRLDERLRRDGIEDITVTLG